MDIPDHINESIEAIAALHLEAERRLTPHQRGIERVTNAIGRPYFLYSVVGAVALWIAANLLLPLVGIGAFDPFPFQLLQGLVTFSALIIATMVLITQNRQLKLAEKHSHLDLQINLLSEGKVAKVISLLEELRRDLPNVRNRPDHEAEVMGARTDPQEVAKALEESIVAEVRREEEGESAPPPDDETTQPKS